jgi:hypothetical protein
MDPVSFLEVNRTGRGFEQAFPSTDEVKEMVELYIYLAETSWTVLGRPLPLLYLFFLTA